MNMSGPDSAEAAEDSAESALEMIISEGGIDLFPTETRAEVERVLAPGQALEPAARSRLVEAARRGALARSAGRRPVERLLFESRRAAARSIEDVAGSVGVEARVLTEVERGDSRITRLKADQVASWMSALGVDAQTAVSALSTSLVTRPPSLAYAARPDGELEPDDELFISAVRVALGLDKDNTSAP